MARSTQNENEMEVSENLSASDAWARAAANRKYGLHDGVPYVGAEGHVVPLPVPGEWFASVPVASQGTVFQALAEYIGNRVAQPEAKKDSATHYSVVAAAASALTNGFEPAMIREKDPVDAAVEREFAALVRARVLEQRPDATDAQIEREVEKHTERENGKAKLRELRDKVLSSGTYQVRRQNRKGAVPELSDIEVSL